VSRTGPKNLPGNGVTRTRAPRAKSSTPRTPHATNITPAKPSNGASATRSTTSSGLMRAPKVKTTTHNPSKSTMRAARKADAPSKI
jgi:hypothetical protein